MSTVMSQGKAVAIQVGTLAALDKFIYKEEFEMKQLGADAANIFVANNWTEPMLENALSGVTSSIDPMMKKLVFTIAVQVGQDMLMAKFLGTRHRSAMESLISFGGSGFVTEQLQSRFPLFA